MGRILVIDDSKDVRKRVIDVLKETDLFKEYVEAEDGISGFKSLAQNPADIVLCDLVMPKSDGLHFLGMKKSAEGLSEIPVLMLTGSDSVGHRVQTLNAGASDFIAKPFHPEELIARTRVHVALKRLRDELQQKNAMLEELNRTDALTNVYNRRYFMEVLETEYSRTRRANHTMAFVMLDLDHFKRVNDDYGHLAGDKALIEVAGILKRVIRKHDICCRYGGEEFALILPETDLSGAAVVTERCREEVSNAVIEFDGKRIPVTISVGVAVLEIESTWSQSDLVAAADEALYKSKEQGRNKVSFADSSAR